MDIKIIEEAYGVYWDKVKHAVDSDGWASSKDLPHFMDAFYEVNTGKEIVWRSFKGEWRGWINNGNSGRINMSPVEKWIPKELLDKVSVRDKTISSILNK